MKLKKSVLLSIALLGSGASIFSYAAVYNITGNDANIRGEHFKRLLQNVSSGDQIIFSDEVKLLQGTGKLDIPNVTIKSNNNSKLHIEGYALNLTGNAIFDNLKLSLAPTRTLSESFTGFGSAGADAKPTLIVTNGHNLTLNAVTTKVDGEKDGTRPIILLGGGNSSEPENLAITNSTTETKFYGIAVDSKKSLDSNGGLVENNASSTKNIITLNIGNNTNILGGISLNGNDEININSKSSNVSKIDTGDATNVNLRISEVRSVGAFGVLNTNQNANFKSLSLDGVEVTLQNENPYASNNISIGTLELKNGGGFKSGNRFYDEDNLAITVDNLKSEGENTLALNSGTLSVNSAEVKSGKLGIIGSRYGITFPDDLPEDEDGNYIPSVKEDMQPSPDHPPSQPEPMKPTEENPTVVDTGNTNPSEPEPNVPEPSEGENKPENGSNVGEGVTTEEDKANGTTDGSVEKDTALPSGTAEGNSATPPSQPEPMKPTEENPTVVDTGNTNPSEPEPNVPEPSEGENKPENGSNVGEGVTTEEDKANGTDDSVEKDTALPSGTAEGNSAIPPSQPEPMKPTEENPTVVDTGNTNPPEPEPNVPELSEGENKPENGSNVGEGVATEEDKANGTDGLVEKDTALPSGTAEGNSATPPSQPEPMKPTEENSLASKNSVESRYFGFGEGAAPVLSGKLDMLLLNQLSVSILENGDRSAYFVNKDKLGISVYPIGSKGEKDSIKINRYGVELHGIKDVGSMLRLGGYIKTFQQDVKYSEVHDYVKVKGWQAGGHIQYDMSNSLTTRLHVSGGQYSVKASTARKVISDIATVESRSRQNFGQVDLGLNIPTQINHDFYIEPMLNFQHTILKVPTTLETSQNDNVSLYTKEGKTLSQTSVQAGVKFRYRATDKFDVETSFVAGIRLSSQNQIVYSLSGHGGGSQNIRHFYIVTPQKNRLLSSATIGVKYRLNKALSLKAGMGYIYSEQYRYHNGYVGAQFSF